MHIEMLGTRAKVEPSSPYHSRYSGVLVEGNLMLDVGEREFLEKAPGYILITHLHPDHAFFVNEKVPIDAEVFAPEKSENLPSLKVLDGRTSVGGFEITPIPTHHSVKVRSQGYLVEKGELSLFYTGDLAWIDKRYHDEIKGVNLVICDASLIRKGGRVLRHKGTGQIYGHAGIPDLMDMFEGLTDNLLLTHFGSWFIGDARNGRRRIRELSRNIKIKVRMAHDGMELDISDLE